jgi:hypothetical protein
MYKSCIPEPKIAAVCHNASDYATQSALWAVDGAFMDAFGQSGRILEQSGRSENSTEITTRQPDLPDVNSFVITVRDASLLCERIIFPYSSDSLGDVPHVADPIRRPARWGRSGTVSARHAFCNHVELQ